LLLQDSNRRFVVGFVADLRDKLGVEHFAVLIQDDDRASQEAPHGTVDQEHTVGLAEARVAEAGGGQRFSRPSAVQKRLEAKGRSAETQSTVVLATVVARALNFRRLVAQTAVSRLGKMLSTTLRPA
jgi:hypothetical protein